MEALGVTRDNSSLYWHGRQMTEKVIREFIAEETTKAAYPFLRRIQELGLHIHSFDDRVEQDDFDIALSCSDVYGLIDITYLMQSDGTEYFVVHNNIKFVGDSDSIDDISDIQPQVNCLADLAANKQRVAELERANAEMAAQIIELKADIAERRLRPGGEDYVAARERFTMGEYE